MTITAHIQQLIQHFKSVSLNEIIKEAHITAKQKKTQGEDYQRAFMAALWPDVQSLYNVKISQREMHHFEKTLWITIDLWRSTQGKKANGTIKALKTTGELLEMISRVTHKYMTEKSTNTFISPT